MVLLENIIYECHENGKIVTPEFCSKCPEPCEEEIKDRKNKLKK